MSTTQEVIVSEILTELRQLGKPLPTFPPGLAKVTVNVFTLQNGTTLWCCEYFHLTMKDGQLVDIKVYCNNASSSSNSPTLSIDDDDDDDIIIDNSKPSKTQSSSSIMIPNSSLSNPSLLKSFPSTPSSSSSSPFVHQKKYKINEKTIYVNVHKKHYIF